MSAVFERVVFALTVFLALGFSRTTLLRLIERRRNVRLLLFASAFCVGCALVAHLAVPPGKVFAKYEPAPPIHYGDQ